MSFHTDTSKQKGISRQAFITLLHTYERNITIIFVNKKRSQIMSMKCAFHICLL